MADLGIFGIYPGYLEPTVRPPRLGGNRRVGVFATRSPFRPNPIGLSSVKLIGVEFREKEGPVLIVEGADLLDMTPIYDIKPYLPYVDSHPEAKGGFAEEKKDYKLDVNFPEMYLEQIPAEKRAALIRSWSRIRDLLIKRIQSGFTACLTREWKFISE